MKDRIVDFIIEFMEESSCFEQCFYRDSSRMHSLSLAFFQCPQDIDKEIKDLKIALNTRLRAAAPWRILRMRLQSVRRISTGSFSIRLEATRLSPWIITEPHLVWIFRSFTWPWRLCPKIYSWHVLTLQFSLRQRRTCLNFLSGAKPEWSPWNVSKNLKVGKRRSSATERYVEYCRVVVIEVI